MDFKVPEDHPGRGPNCGVTAVAIVSGKSFRETKRAMRAVRGAGRSWRGISSHQDQVETLQVFGIDHEVTEPSMLLRTFVNAVAKRDTTYMVQTAGHLQVVRNGYVIDNQYRSRTIGPQPVDIFWGKNKRIMYVTEIKG